MRSILSWVGLAIVVTGIIVLVFADVFTDMAGLEGGRIVSLVAMTALLVVIRGRMLGAYRGKGTMMLQHIALWLAIIAVLSLLYIYRGALGFGLN
jgi:hypothetical protein